jgi:hypothetical protein
MTISCQLILFVILFIPTRTVVGRMETDNDIYFCIISEPAAQTNVSMPYECAFRY